MDPSIRRRFSGGPTTSLEGADDDAEEESLRFAVALAAGIAAGAAEDDVADEEDESFRFTAVVV